MFRLRSPIGEKLRRSLKPWILRNSRILNNLSKAEAIALGEGQEAKGRSL
ncbi:hypothetical protein [Trichocoleus sp. FACHB-262]|nr:hypothetical protein [Trichocoleus sp. FACHB-262]MBD2119316.1 hypothetical protein [Trichocoleus sp. FACHB-262]